MKLNINYTGDTKGFNLSMDLDIDNIEDNAEALGYITNVLGEATMRLIHLCNTANPKYQIRIAKGIVKSLTEKQNESNPHYPFTTFIKRDESQK